MKKLFKKIFDSSVIMKISLVFSMVFIMAIIVVVLKECMAENCPEKYIQQDILYIISFVLLAVCNCALFVSYINHDKNVMKCLIGLSLALLLSVFISFQLVFGISVLPLVSMIFVVAIITIHLLINSDHHSRPNIVFISQITAIAYIIFTIVEMIILIIYQDNLIMIAFNAAAIFTTVLVLCIQSKLDSFRMKREEEK